MDWPFPPTDKMTADEAIAIWFDGDFTGEESALLEVIKKGLSLSLDDQSLTEMICNCMDRGMSVEQCRKRLIEAAK